MQVAEIRAERFRQIRQGHVKQHDRRWLDEDWLLFIGRRMRSIREGGKDPIGPLPPWRRKELYLHIAALAVAAIEAQE